MRQRIEDLGRLAVMIRNLTDHDLFDASQYGRPKDFFDWWEPLTQEKKDDWLHDTVYRIQGVEHALYDMLTIAEGQDYLNDPSETR